MELTDDNAPKHIKAAIEDWKEGRITKARLCDIFGISMLDFTCTGADMRHATSVIWEDIKKCHKVLRPTVYHEWICDGDTNEKYCDTEYPCYLKIEKIQGLNPIKPAVCPFGNHGCKWKGD